MWQALLKPLFLLALFAVQGGLQVSRIEGQWRAYFTNPWGLTGSLFGWGLVSLLLH
jgi:hypothetical protein